MLIGLSILGFLFGTLILKNYLTEQGAAILVSVSLNSLKH